MAWSRNGTARAPCIPSVEEPTRYSALSSPPQALAYPADRRPIMDFSYTETQQQIQELANRIMADYCTQQRLRQLDDDGYHDDTLWQQLADSGLLGIALEDNNGGMGLDVESLCLLFESAGRHAAPVPLIPVLAGAALPLQSLKIPSLSPLLRHIADGTHRVTHAATRLIADKEYRPNLQAHFANDSWTVSGIIDNVPAAEGASHCWSLAMAGDEIVAVLLDLNAHGVM